MTTSVILRWWVPSKLFGWWMQPHVCSLITCGWITISDQKTSYEPSWLNDHICWPTHIFLLAKSPYGLVKECSMGESQCLPVISLAESRYSNAEPTTRKPKRRSRRRLACGRRVPKSYPKGHKKTVTRGIPSRKKKQFLVDNNLPAPASGSVSIGGMVILFHVSMGYSVFVDMFIRFYTYTDVFRSNFPWIWNDPMIHHWPWGTTQIII